MKFPPLHDRVAVRRAEGDIKSRDEIIIPDTTKEKPQEGIIVALSPGSRDDNGRLIELDNGAGDPDHFANGQRSKSNSGEDLPTMKETDVMDIVET